MDDEYLTVSDGMHAVNMVRRFGFVTIVGRQNTLADLNNRVGKGLARGGIRFAEVVMPGAVKPLEASDRFWKLEEASAFKIASTEDNLRVLSYRLNGGSEGGTFKLWYDPRTLRPVKMVSRNNIRGTTTEKYYALSEDGPIPDDEFEIPPGNEEESIRGTRAAFEEYVTLLAARNVKEIWVERGQLVAHLREGIRRNGQCRRQIIVEVPQETLSSDAGLKKLSDGVRPDRVHVAEHYR